MGVDPKVTSCRAACSQGDDRTCAVMAVNEVEYWSGDPSALAKEPDARLPDLATRTGRACSDGYQPACLASRRVGIETELRQAQALGSQIPRVRNDISLAHMLLTNPAHDLDKAQAAADDALKTAKAAADAAAEAEARQKAEEAEEEACASDAAKCQADCRADGTSDRCWAFAFLLASGDGRVAKAGQDLGRAREMVTLNCKAGNQGGCTVAAKIDKAIADLFSQVTAVGDDLAQKQFAVETLSQQPPTPRILHDLPLMVSLNRQEVAGSYCPAKKQFVQQGGAAEFQRRAAAHCKDEPPYGQGLTGVGVKLTNECVSVYATACP